MRHRYALLVDGGFARKVLKRRLGNDPTAQEILATCYAIHQQPALAGWELLRIYYYDAPPSEEHLTHPIDGSSISLARTKHHEQAAALLRELETSPYVAVRLGELAVLGWQLGRMATREMLKQPRMPTARDFTPMITQKGVDLRIGLDIARLALRQLVDAIVVISGDSDLVPAFKFARREGLLVYLHHLGNPVRRQLTVHVDLVF